MSTVVVAQARPRASRLGERGGREARRLRSALSSRVYLPACGIAVAAVVLIAFGWSMGWGQEDFTSSTAALGVVVAGPATLSIIGIFLIVERLWPAQRRSLFARGYRHDLLFLALNATILVPFVTGLTLAFMAVVRDAVPWIVLPKIGMLPRWGAVALIVVAMDGCNWFVHLANHRVRMLWRFHELHHSQEDMSVLTVARTHPLIHVSFVFSLVPVLVLLANGVMSTTVLVVYGAMVAFVHSNTRLGYGPLERIFVSPNYHRIHHKVDGPQDVNLGFALTIWDQIFGRAVFPTDDTVRADTGLPGRPLIVEQSTPRPRHLRVFAAQMIAPFRPMRTTDGPPVRAPKDSLELADRPLPSDTHAAVDELQEAAR
jgi:sterol desaturase/sphingolipid hydroxylase (fatty acid hydroxylase superfamily)